MARMTRFFHKASPTTFTFPGWPDGHSAALSFTFDDARRSQIEFGLPLFRDLAIAVTFFVLPDPLSTDVDGWSTAIEHGHELGNHTNTHPCSGNFAWSRANSLESMNVADFEAELRAANARLHALVGVTPRVFAYPCGQTFVGFGRGTRSLVPLISESFDVGRTFNDVSSNSPATFDPAKIACVNCDTLTFGQLEAKLEESVAEGAWLVLGGHEIGNTGQDDATFPETIEKVVGWCREHSVWVDTVGRIGRTTQERRSAQRITAR